MPDVEPSGKSPQSAECVDTGEVRPLTASPFLSLREAAEWLCVSRSTLKRMIGRGELTTVLVGKRHKVPADCLSTYVTRDILLPEAVSEPHADDFSEELKYL